MKRNVKVYAASSIIIGAMVLLIVVGFNSETMMYAVSVKELAAQGDNAHDRGYRLTGMVSPETIQKAPDLLSVEFVVHEDDETIPVYYRGILPDTFKPADLGGDIEVVLEGRVEASGKFHATNIMTKCASKYEPEDGEYQKTYSKDSSTDNAI